MIEYTSGGSERCGSGGYFAFVTNDKMSIFHYSTEFGVAYTPVEPEDIWHFTMSEQQLLLFFGCIPLFGPRCSCCSYLMCLSDAICFAFCAVLCLYLQRLYDAVIQYSAALCFCGVD